ncbi:DUF4338 domain-containing protein [Desulfobacterales bacterium HSG2]|nr:DUF4338 domain-containing protein [Desulfobacterales bacterium HSG2]
MTQKKITPICQSGREITPQQIEEIQETIDMFRRLSRSELAKTICEHLEWYTPSGSQKVEACTKLLERLEERKLIKLPKKRPSSKSGPETPVTITEKTDPPPEDIVAKLKALAPINLYVAKEKEDSDLWKEYVMRYHYLGYKKPFGCYIRYFIKCDRGILGAALFSGSSKSIGLRDRWIGWTLNHRLRNHGWVINNSRFLIFPWVKVPYLASHVLGKIARQVARDWEDLWDYQPVLMETFVDPRKFQATCYRAANWEYLGITTGEGHVRKDRGYRTTPKKIYVKPLIKNFRDILCSDEIAGW